MEVTGGEFGEGTGHILEVLGRLAIEASFFVTGGYRAQPGSCSAKPQLPLRCDP